jgi:hypothetical protein
MEGNMKCPKCQSVDTRKVWVHEPDWKIGTQRCLNPLCGHVGDWLLFCELPIVIDYDSYKIILPGIDDKENK